MDWFEFRAGRKESLYDKIVKVNCIVGRGKRRIPAPSIYPDCFLSYDCENTECIWECKHKKNCKGFVKLILDIGIEQFGRTIADNIKKARLDI